MLNGKNMPKSVYTFLIFLFYDLFHWPMPLQSDGESHVLSDTTPLAGRQENPYE